MRHTIDELYQKLHIGDSIASRLRISFTVVMVLLLIPGIVSLSTMAGYARRYHSVLGQVERVSSLKPVVQSSIPDEMWNIVAGRISFEDGTQYEMVNSVNAALNELMRSAATDNPKELIVARRTMDTLSGYIDRMGRLMTYGHTVAESEALLEEVRSVSNLVSDMLAEYVDAEIAAAAEMSDQLQSALITTLSLVGLLMLATFLFSVFAQKSLSRSIHKPIAQMEAFAGALAGGNLQARAPDTRITELKGLTASLNIMAGKLQDLIDENRREQENLKKSELRTLQAQINPHFLYNTLDAIVWLAEAERTDEVIHITRALSDFFRISLSQGRDWIPLSQEVKHLTGYLTIQKIRYRDILDYEIDVPEALYDRQVLKLLLQPLVENAIYHGIKHRRGRGKVLVTAREEDGNLILSVADNGAGMDAQRLEQVRGGLRGENDSVSGYGLFNVNKRIQLYYNQSQGLTIQSDVSGTTVSLRVPTRSIDTNV